MVSRLLAGRLPALLVGRLPALLAGLLPALCLLAGCLPGAFVARDGDGDGYPVDQEGKGDCDDADPLSWPGAPERCDGRDNSCDGSIDEGFPDEDQDGVADCQDAEECDGADNDGDGAIDEEFPDTDGDGVADCQDVEACDGVDNDGDGSIDEEFPDTDGDGEADCVDPDDCEGDNDGDGTVNCLDTEACDGVDNDGDGKADEGFKDTDRDGRADCVDLESCDGVDNDGDGKTDEGFPDSNGDGVPDCASPELCDGKDNDGDGGIDEGFDADWRGGADCSDEDGDGFTELKGDCDDTSSSISPDAPYELSDGRDNDCDGTIDEVNDVADALYQVSGAPSSSRAGAALALADLDGNGLLERIVGAPGGLPGEESERAGVVYLEAGTSTLPTAGKLGNARNLTLGVAGDRFGEALAVGYDGEGAPLALAVGAPGSSSGAGLVAVWPVGGSLQELAARAPARIDGAEAGSGLGTSLGFIPDLSGDGIPDLVVGAPGAIHPDIPARGATGAAFFFSGADLEPDAVLSSDDAFFSLAGVAAGDRFGASLAPFGDLDLDGVHDIAVGAPGAAVGDLASAVRVYLYYGGALLEGCAGVCTLAFEGGAAGGELGGRVVNAGDMDGDGIEDLVMASSYVASIDPPTWIPEIYYFPGADALTLDPDGGGTVSLLEAYSWQTALYDTTTRVVSLLGGADLDGDGSPDLMVGIPSDGTDPTFSHEGLVAIHSIFDLFLSSSLEFGYVTFVAGSPAALGTGLGAGDLNGDGAIEMLLGAPEAGGGTVYVYPGE